MFEINSDTLKALSGEAMVALVQKVCRGMVQGAKTLEDGIFMWVLAVIRKWLPDSGVTYLENRSVTNMVELENAICGWLAGRAEGNFFRKGGEMVKPNRLARGGEFSRGGLTCFRCGEAGHRVAECKVGLSSSSSTDRGTDTASRPRPITCFSCKKEGHKAPDCPSKKVGQPVVKSVHQKGRTNVFVNGLQVGGAKDNVVLGSVNGVATENLVDSGADFSLVPRALIPEGSEDCGECVMFGVHNTRVTYKKSKATFVIDGRVIERVVAVDEHPMEQTGCLLSINLRNKEELRGIEKALERYSVCALTRSMARAEALEKCESDVVVKGPSGAKRALNECVNGVIVDVPVTEGMEAAEVRTVPLWSCIEDEGETGAGAEMEPSISELGPGVEESGRVLCGWGQG